MPNFITASNDSSYQYEERDIDRVVPLLLQTLPEPQRNEVKYIGAIGRVRNDDPIIKISHIKTKIDTALQENPDIGKFVGIYNTGGNHWISFVILRDIHVQEGAAASQAKSYMVWFKDSLGGECKDFQDDINTVLVAEASMIRFDTFNGREQTDGVSCGIFAIKNMMVLASKVPIDFIPDMQGFFLQKLNRVDFLMSVIAQKMQYERAIKEARRELPKYYADNGGALSEEETLALKPVSNPEALRLEDLYCTSSRGENTGELESLDTDIDDVMSSTAGLRLVSTNQKPHFVISTIARAPKRKWDEDSSDEESDGTFVEEMYDFPEDNLPFHTAKPRKALKTHHTFNELEQDFFQTSGESLVLGQFLDKMSQTGFEEQDKHLLPTSIKASIAVNRMQSLSTRNNKELYIELSSNIETDIRYEKFGFFWKCQWYDANNKPVEYKDVRKFYKQLKRKNPEKAKEFLKITESGIMVPYQELREYAKNHEKTKGLVQEFREQDPNSRISMSFIDADTDDFNGIYSAYLRIDQNTLITPTVMTTSYEHPFDQESGACFQEASRISREINFIINKFIPGGVYFTEANFCVEIPEGHDTLPESFVDRRTFPNGNNEAAILLRQVNNRPSATFVFSLENPLITTIMDRARLMKNQKKDTPISITFTKEFVEGASPTEKDLKLFKQISQCSFNEKVWYDNLFINRAFVTKIIAGKGIQYCKSLLSQIRNARSIEEKNSVIEELKVYIDLEIVDKIVQAIEEVNKYVEKIKIDYIRSENEQGLLDIILQIENIEISHFPRSVILMLSQKTVLDIIETGIIDLQVLSLAIRDQSGLSADLANIFYEDDDDQILRMLQDKSIAFNDLLSLHKISQIHREDFTKALKNFIDAVNKGGYSGGQIVTKYAENPLHLTFMSGDPTAIILENADDWEIVRCGIENDYEIDLDWIRGQLNIDHNSEDLNSASLMLFDNIIGYVGGEKYDPGEDEYECQFERFSLSDSFIDVVGAGEQSVFVN